MRASHDSHMTNKCIHRSKRLSVSSHEYNYEQINDGSSYESFMAEPDNDF